MTGIACRHIVRGGRQQDVADAHGRRLTEARLMGRMKTAAIRLGRFGQFEFALEQLGNGALDGTLIIHPQP